MKEFMYCDFNISDITLACFVGANMGRRKHENRPSHGLALHLDGDKEYHFSDGRIVKVKKNDIIYLPKKSTYFVKINAPGECYAINFQISEDLSFVPFSVGVKAVSDFVHLFKSVVDLKIQSQLKAEAYFIWWECLGL